MAAPVARGSTATLAPRAAWKMTPSLSSRPSAASATRNNPAARTAPSATQRSCSRSVPRARRKRSSSDTAPTTSAIRMITAPTGNSSASGPSHRAATPSGFPMAGYSGYRGWGLSTAVRKATTSPAAARRGPPAPAGRRQRPGGGEQQDEAETGEVGEDAAVGQPGQPAGGPEGAPTRHPP